MMLEEGEMSAMRAMDMRDVANPMEECDPRRRRRCIVTGISLLVVILVIVTASVAGGGKNGRSGGDQSYDTINVANEDIYFTIQEAMENLNIPTDDLLLIGSYRYKALEWLVKTPEAHAISPTRKLQRFALGCLFYNTNQVATKLNPNPGPWTDNTDVWMSDEHECDWPGVDCTTEEKVHSISLEHNGLSGKLPFELGLLWEHLKVLELSFNDITMEGFDWDVFLYLPHLQKLAMSANHVVSNSGVPDQLLACKKLREIVLSDNDISGPLENGVLDNMGKLTHLEIEYNALTGYLNVLSKLPALEQIYLRHNALLGHLTFLKADMPKLLSIWLDGNSIDKKIPTEIGKLTNLRSISIADDELTGTIPSEVGLLTNLQRLWLYRNELTGSVPSELENLTNLELLKLEENDLTGAIPSKVCETFNHSSYSKSAITADCDKVSCECCTECF
jgi:hypothetical protein